jgi:tetratricopeptide (TPR) repeat protein
MAIYFLIVLLILLLGIAVLLFWKWKTGVSRRIHHLETEINRLQPLAFARDLARLNQYQRRLGVVFIDSLPVSADPVIRKSFEAGLKFAEQGLWDKAYQFWNEAKSRAKGDELASLHFLCGGCLFLRRQIDAAERELNLALMISRQTGNKVGISATMFVLAGLAREQGKLPMAQKLLEQSVRITSQVGNAGLTGRTLVRLAEIYHAEQQYALAIERYRQASKLFESEGNLSLASIQYYSIGGIYFELGELDKARAAYEDGLHLARATRSRINEANNLMAIGVVHRVQGDYKRALELLDRALRLYREINFIKGQVQVLHELALVHEKNNELDIAREFFEQGLLFARRIRDAQLMVNNLLGLALNCMFHYNYDRAKTLIEEAANIGNQLNSAAVSTRIQIVLARLYLRQGEIARAIETLNTAIVLAREAHDRRHEAKALLELTRALRLAGKIEEATNTIQRFWKQFNGMPDRELEGDAWSEDGLLRAAKDEIKPALESLKKAYDRHLKLGVKRAVAEDLVQLGKLLIQSRQFTEAQSVLREAITTAESAADYGVQAQALSLLGDALFALKEPGGVELYNKALELYRSISDLRGEATTLQKIGAVFYEESLWDKARLNLEQAARIFQRINDQEGIEAVKAVMNKLPVTEVGLKFTSEY